MKAITTLLMALTCLTSLSQQSWVPVVSYYYPDEFYSSFSWYAVAGEDTIAHGGLMEGTQYNPFSPYEEYQSRSFFMPTDQCVRIILRSEVTLGFGPAYQGTPFNFRILRPNTAEVLFQAGPNEFTGYTYEQTIVNTDPCDPGTPECIGDLDGDGHVGILDLMQFIIHFGNECD